MVFFCKESLEMEKVCLLWARFLFVAPSDIDQQANWRGESLKIKKGECGGMHWKNILITKIIILAHFEFSNKQVLGGNLTCFKTDGWEMGEIDNLQLTSVFKTWWDESQFF